MTAAERGTATHLALRYLDLAAIRSEADAREAVDALALAGRMSRRDAAAVDAGSVYALAASPLGARMAAAEEVKREFSFSLLRPAGELLPARPTRRYCSRALWTAAFRSPAALWW